jgi:hypothetical protein
MSTNALWISHQERVEVLSSVQLDQHAHKRYMEPKYRARRSDGSIVMIERRDILLREEEEIIDELAHILNQSHNPARNERYSHIMHYLIRKGVPFTTRLQNQLPKHRLQQSLDLPDVG